MINELLYKYRFVTSTEVTELVIHRGAVGPEVNNQLSYRGLYPLLFNSILNVVLQQ